MPHDFSNILELSRFRDRGPSESGPRDEQPADELQTVDEMQAIASCLDYLYGELMKLRNPMAAHLTGAAAESLRQEVQRMRKDT